MVVAEVDAQSMAYSKFYKRGVSALSPVIAGLRAINQYDSLMGRGGRGGRP